MGVFVGETGRSWRDARYDRRLSLEIPEDKLELGVSLTSTLRDITVSSLASSLDREPPGFLCIWHRASGGTGGGAQNRNFFLVVAWCPDDPRSQVRIANNSPPLK